MRPRLTVLAILFFIGVPYLFGSDPFSLSGTVTNTANPAKPTIASATISFDAEGKCVLRIGTPLYGSGSCWIDAIDESHHTLSIRSNGPAADITCNGMFDGEGYRGTYVVDFPNFPELSQTGNFSLAFDEKPLLLRIEDVLTKVDFTNSGNEFHVLVERDLGVFFDKGYKYTGIRLFLDAEQNPTLRIEDHKDGSLYIDPKSNKTLMEWHTDGKSGYFSKTANSVTTYYDRFMNYTRWSSIDVQGEAVFAYEDGDSIELYDSALKYLNIRSGKTSAGKVFWMKTDSDGITEYFDDSMNSLHWYSAVRDGQTYYANVVGKKVRVYDANLQPIRHKSGFWSNMARGFATGLAAYGQALQTQAAAASSEPQTYSQPAVSYNTTTQQIGDFGYSTTTGSSGAYYNTTTQSIGNFDYSTTTGSNGYFASTTRQQIGNFGYINGVSSNGSISGTQQRIGNFDYSHYATPEGQWNGTSQQIGNFTYHTFTAPDGSMHSGTSQRIGDFVYTSIH